MEFTSFGHNVIVAGESYIKNKHITLDPKSQKEYFEILDKLPFNSKPNDNLIYIYVNDSVNTQYWTKSDTANFVPEQLYLSIFNDIHSK